jgi:threonine synthase
VAGVISSVSGPKKFNAWFECFAGCDTKLSLEDIVYRCPSCDGLLEVRHDMDALGSVSPEQWKETLSSRTFSAGGVWSKKELILPVIDDRDIVSLGEGNTPLLSSPRMASDLGVEEIFIKQCGTSHTGSFKDLGMTVLVSMVNRIRSRVRAVACASTGDTSAALAAYCAAAGIPSIVFLPRDKISLAQLIQPISNGALTLSLDTDFDGCMEIVRQVTQDGSIYLANSMNSLRVEGQKTISLEIAQQLGWEVPDYVVVPGGNLGNISAISSGFRMARELGLIDRLPRLVCAQTERANPLYRAYQTGFDQFEPMTAGETMATAIQIGNPVSFPKAVRALKDTNGIVAQVTEAELADAASFGDRYGFFNDPQTGVALGVTRKLIASGAIESGARVVVISTAHGLKFADFKLKSHEGRVPDTDPALRNLPIEVSADIDQIRAVLDGNLNA